jgi:hypothetical protein
MREVRRDIAGADAARDEVAGSTFRLLVAITFHYREARLPLLLSVARSFLAFPAGAIDLVVLTNTTAEDETRRIVAMLEPLVAPGVERADAARTFRLESHPGLPDPWLLLWRHKPLIRDRFLARGDYTHFIYAEDDILMSWANFRYFVDRRALLARHGLIPGFQRIEYNEGDGNLYLLDQTAPEDLDGLRKVDAGSHWFVTPHFPHCALFVLDRPLAEEYCASPSFDLDTSIHVARHYGVAERAAMGLCFERIPVGFETRWAVPVHKQRRSTSPDCWLFHIANNYTTDPKSPFGKIRPGRMFAAGANAPHLELKALPAALPAGGYVDHIRIDAQAFIHGWGLLQSQTGRSSLYIDTNLPVVEAHIARSARGDVAAAIRDARLIDCGFQIRLVLDSAAALPDSPRIQLWSEDAVYGRHHLRSGHLPPLTVAPGLPDR